jgi:hypothetical protein
MSNNIFAKKSEKKVYYDKIDIEHVKKTIPNNNYRESQPLLVGHMVELRWRFLHIQTTIDDEKQSFIKKMVEISKKTPSDKRVYLNKNMNWTDVEIDPIYDNFVVEQYYVYTDK